MTQFLEQELGKSVLPPVVPYIIIRGGHYPIVELPEQITNRFVQNLADGMKSPLTSFRFRDIYETGEGKVRFYTAPPDASIISIRNQQYQVIGTTDGFTYLSPNLRQPVSNQYSANLVAYPLQLIDIIAVRTFRIEPTVPIAKFDSIQIGNARLTVDRVNETPGSTEIHTVEQLYNTDAQQSCYLLASPLSLVSGLDLTDGLPNARPPDCPFLFELPLSTHLDLDYRAVWLVDLLDAGGGTIQHHEVDTPSDLLVLNRPISAGSMLLWDKVGKGSLDWDGQNLILVPDPSDNRMSLESLLVPEWPAEQVEQYSVRVQCDSEVTIRFQLYPNPPQDRTITESQIVRFDGPARMEQASTAIRLSIESPTLASVKLSDLTPSPMIEGVTYRLLVIPGNDVQITRHDVLWASPIVKPLWSNVRDLYLKTDTGTLDSGWILGY